jgi:hypothetical protein
LHIRLDAPFSGFVEIGRTNWRDLNSHCDRSYLAVGIVIDFGVALFGHSTFKRLASPPRDTRATTFESLDDREPSTSTSGSTLLASPCLFCRHTENIGRSDSRLEGNKRH